MKYSFGLIVKGSEITDSFEKCAESVASSFSWNFGPPEISVSEKDPSPISAYFQAEIEIDNVKEFFHDVVVEFSAIAAQPKLHIGPMLPTKTRAYAITSTGVRSGMQKSITSSLQVFLNPCL